MLFYFNYTVFGGLYPCHPCYPYSISNNKNNPMINIYDVVCFASPDLLNLYIRLM